MISDTDHNLAHVMACVSLLLFSYFYVNSFGILKVIDCLEDVLTGHKENVRAQAGFIWLGLCPLACSYGHDNDLPFKKSRVDWLTS